MEDLIIRGGNRTLTLGIRNDGIVVGISGASDTVLHLPLSASAATRAAAWLTRAAGEARQVDGLALLGAAHAAMRAYSEGRFVPQTSREMWNRGFDCDSDRCEWAAGDGWAAIYDPDAMEIEAYVVDEDLGLTDAVRVNVTTGAVVPL